MSNLVICYFDRKSIIDYNHVKQLSDELVKLALTNDKGIIFEFLGYDEEFIKSLGDKFYFAVSDDFIQLNSEFMNLCKIDDIRSTSGKGQFLQEMKIFDDISALLCSYGISKFDLLISTDNSDCLDDFKIISAKNDSISKVLYHHLLSNLCSNGYDFTDIIIRK